MSVTRASTDVESFQRLKNDYYHLQQLYQITQGITGVFNSSQVLQQLLASTASSIGASGGSVFILDSRGHVDQHLMVNSQLKIFQASAFSTRVLLDGLGKLALEQRKSVLIKDTQADELALTYPTEFMGMRSIIASPLISGRRVRGVLVLVHPEPGYFNNENLDLLNLVAHHAALTIENVYLVSEINDERRKFEGAVTAMEEGLILVDREGNLRFVNPQALNFFELTAPIPSSINDISLELASLWNEALKTGENLQAELLLTGPPRVDLAVNISYMPIVAEDGDWWTILLHDTTRIKEYDRLKTQFVANASHELRTPLANIKLYARLAENSKDDVKRKSYLETIASEAGRLESLVEDLLTLSRLDSGMVQCDIQPCSVDGLLSRLIPTYVPLADTRTMRLSLNLPEEPLPLALADPDQLTRVIVNLVSNALKFTPPHGSVAISVYEMDYDEEPGIAVSIQDTGPGIALEEQPKLFERFYRGQNPTIGGTGLGLTIVRDLMVLMSGKILVKSTVGEGSTFTCWLPQVTESLWLGVPKDFPER